MEDLRLTTGDRFVLERLIGCGGMGKVYQAFDRLRGHRVALKTVRDVEPVWLYRLKHEFRAVAELSHPNLAALHELFSTRESCFFTMEFVEGTDFLEYVRGEEEPLPVVASGPPPPLTGSLPTAPACEGPISLDALPPPPASCFGGERPKTSRPAVAPDQLERLRAALAQLVAGVHCLHQAGQLHRDLKPSNVMVTPAGRVVILDFGLATGVAADQRSSTTEGLLIGTVPYMAPEQAAGGELSAASDWYAVGVMLYEVLTGQLPFAGTLLQALLAKQQGEPRPPGELVRGIPDDLIALCVRLLRRDPTARPSDEEMLQLVGAASAALSLATAPGSASQSPFVGRREQLDLLQDAMENVRQGRTTVVYVEGRSGVGKSALVRRFLDSLGPSKDTVVLAGRCHQCESVPYKALDSLVDALSHYLLRRTPAEVDALLPRDVTALAQAFPVLRRVEAIADLSRREDGIQNSGELRDRAFAALRELLCRLGDRRDVVLHIDDFQWGDLDSVALLDDLLRPPHPPRLLAVIAYRSEDRETSAALRALLSAKPARDALVVRRLDVGPLSHEESRQLAGLLIGSEGREAQEAGDWIARESGGNPYFVDALVHYQQPSKDALPPARPAAVGLDEVLWSKACSVPESAFRLLQVIAVAGHPLPSAEACRAAGLTGQTSEMLAVLRAARLIRSSGDSVDESLEAYHDRIRESVVARLPDDALASCHRRLAEALAVSGAADPAVLAAHYVGAGDKEVAGRWYAVAAAQAVEKLAFDRGVNLYRLSLQMAQVDAAQSQVLRRGLADALANAGRGAEAAQEYLELVPSAAAKEASHLRRSAAMQYLVCGHIDDGLAVLRSVLTEAGIRYPRTPGGAKWSFLFSLARLWLRGLSFRRRQAARIAPQELGRVDTCWSAGVGLGLVDPIRGAAFQFRGLLLALRCGEPYRIGRALAAASMHLSSAGHWGKTRKMRMLDLASVLHHETPHPHLDGMIWLARASDAYGQGHWRQAFDCAERAEVAFRNKCTGVTWELDSAQGAALMALHPLGQIAEIARRLPALRAAAERRGDLYAVSLVGTYVGTTATLAANDPDRAERELRSLAERWSQTGFHMQHFHFLYAQAFIDRYRGDGARACRRWADAWPVLVRSQLLRSPPIGIMACHARAASALVAAGHESPPHAFLREAEEYTQALHRLRAGWNDGLWRLLRAGVLASRGEPAAAVPLLERAVDDFATWEMGLYGAAARRRLGELRGGPAGQTLIDDANAWMARQGIVDLARMTALCAPGFPPRVS